MASSGAPVGAQEWVPPNAQALDELRDAAAHCEGCELYQNATQTVFGRGAAHAKIVFVGEQPGDIEDQKGLPFVGPAGRLLREAVDDAGGDPAPGYIPQGPQALRVRRCGRRGIPPKPGP